MIRRDFFKAITAAAAALAAGKTAQAAMAPPVVDLRPRYLVTPALRTQDNAKQRAIALLNKCAVTGFSRKRVGDVFLWEVDYVYDQHGRYMVNLNDDLARVMPSDASPKSIEVVTEWDSIPVWHLGAVNHMPVDEPRHRIIVEWVTK